MMALLATNPAEFLARVQEAIQAVKQAPETAPAQPLPAPERTPTSSSVPSAPTSQTRPVLDLTLHTAEVGENSMFLTLV